MATKVHTRTRFYGHHPERDQCETGVQRWNPMVVHANEAQPSLIGPSTEVSPMAFIIVNLRSLSLMTSIVMN